MDDRTAVAKEIASLYREHPQVQAVALGGSLASQAADGQSDIDLYVYVTEALDPESRLATAGCRAMHVEVGNEFWEPGDEWIERESGVHVDVTFRQTGWAEEQLDRVLRRHEASVGYSTCIWHNLRSARVLFDRSGWLGDLQHSAGAPYPDELVAAILAKNYPILRASASSYRAQIQSAISREDPVSVNHRVAAVLASYFDILFAVNRALHPGEKRLLVHATHLCPRRPRRMIKQVRAVLGATPLGDDLLPALDELIDGLDHMLETMHCL